MTREPSPDRGTVEPMGFDYVARLHPIDQHVQRTLLPVASTWYITHPLGRPAGGTYTEVVFDPLALGTPMTSAELDRLLDEVVRRVAVDLYGTAWAFHYRPDQYEQAIARWGLRRRERVLVTRINVYDDEPQPPPSTYGIRPHTHPRTQSEADAMRRLAEQTPLLGQRPQPDPREDPRP